MPIRVQWKGGGDMTGLSHQSQCGRGSEVTLAPHLVRNTQTGEEGAEGWLVETSGGDEVGGWGSHKTNA